MIDRFPAPCGAKLTFPRFWVARNDMRWRQGAEEAGLEAPVRIPVMKYMQLRGNQTWKGQANRGIRHGKRYLRAVERFSSGAPAECHSPQVWQPTCPNMLLCLSVRVGRCRKACGLGSCVFPTHHPARCRGSNSFIKREEDLSKLRRPLNPQTCIGPTRPARIRRPRCRVMTDD